MDSVSLRPIVDLISLIDWSSNSCYCGGQIRVLRAPVHDQSPVGNPKLMVHENKDNLSHQPTTKRQRTREKEIRFQCISSGQRK